MVRALGLGLACLNVSPACAESAFIPDGCENCAMGMPPKDRCVPGPEYDLLQQRAEGDDGLKRALLQMDRLRMMRPGMDGTQSQGLQAYDRGMQHSLGNPYAYRLAERVDLARDRARTLAQFLKTDLDNDRQLNRQEIRNTLQVAQAPAAAQAFLSSDANADNILSAVEIRAAVDSQMTQQQGDRRRHGNGMVRLIDFDDDGILTSQEIARAAAALGLDP